jgi:hypothetical protein
MFFCSWITSVFPQKPAHTIYMVHIISSYGALLTPHVTLERYVSQRLTNLRICNTKAEKYRNNACAVEAV